MNVRNRHLGSWLMGVLGLAIVVWYFQPSNFAEALRSIGISGVLLWLASTIFARLLLVEITVLPIQALGFRLRRLDAFWIGWIRSFFNQILPFSGLALYAQQMRRKVGISWSQLASLSSPQFFLGALALGLIGTSASICNADVMGHAAFPMGCAFIAVSSCAILVVTNSARFIEALPSSLAVRVSNAAASFRKLAQHRQLASKLTLLHGASILIRGSRIWMLFAFTGTLLDWREALLVVAISESATLFQITPGGLGLREGAVVGAATLLQVSPDVGAAVALIDRLFILATTAALVVPAFLLTAGVQSSDP